MTTPLDRATEALGGLAIDAETRWTLARDALSAALDVDELADVLIQHTRLRGISGDCSCGHIVPLGHSFAAHQARALRDLVVPPVVTERGV